MAFKFPWVLWHHSPNEGIRTPANGAKLKAHGMSPGHPDIMIYDPPAVDEFKHKAGIAIELKAPEPHDGPVRKSQRLWLNHLEERNWLTFICRGFNEARAVVESYYVKEAA
jgi:hypothetical protein